MLQYQSAAGSWNERKRLIRFRRRTEHLRFSQEIKLVPRSLVMAMLAILALGETIALTLCYHNIPETWETVVEYGPFWGTVLAGVIGLSLWTFFSALLFLISYVYVDAKRRGMNAGLWTFLVIVMLPGYVALGFILYFIAREPLPFHCPKCGSLVSARFNYCTGCRYALHPTCTHCQAEVSDMDKFCPRCGSDLSPVPAAETDCRRV
jgi:double zinc ribbon protein